jgi:hypothetical protein
MTKHQKTTAASPDRRARPDTAGRRSTTVSGQAMTAAVGWPGFGNQHSTTDHAGLAGVRSCAMGGDERRSGGPAVPRPAADLRAGLGLGSAGSRLRHRGGASRAGARLPRHGTAGVAVTMAGNLRSRAVMRRIGMTSDPAEDFDDPDVDEEPLRRRVVYRKLPDPRNRRTSRFPA